VKYLLSAADYNDGIATVEISARLVPRGCYPRKLENIIHRSATERTYDIQHWFTKIFFVRKVNTGIDFCKVAKNSPKKI